ncbi:MAG TPA: adenylate/guanylate cyclase domain-containing protein [Chitinophagaceae bacterium]|nr:adenylate/guanylate cyclase domain-containing protein [Chitinophagaceae bacterium]
MNSKNRSVINKLTLAVAFLVSASVYSQKPVEENSNNADTTAVNALIQLSKEKLGTAPDSTISIALQAVELADKIDFPKGKALALKNVGLGYYYQGKYVETLDYWTRSLSIFETLNDEAGIANQLSNIGAVYNDRGDDVKALDYGLRALSLAEKLKDTLRLLSASNLVANIYNGKPQTKDKALTYLLKTLPLCEKTGNTEALGIISGNIGDIYYEKGNYSQAVEYYDKAIAVLGNHPMVPFDYNGIGKVYAKQGNFDQALKYHNQALSMAEKFDVKLRVIESLQGIADVYQKKENFKTAMAYYGRAEKLAEESKLNHSLKDIYKAAAETYEQAGDFRNAYAYQRKLDNIKDTLFNEATEKKLGALQFEFDLQKKQTEINLLTKDKDLQTAKIKRQQFAKNAFLVGLLLAFTIAVLVFRSYLVKARTHKILDKQKNEIENLLLNILPKEVATELQTKGRATPRQYESVSVMFTDFQAFTVIADSMAPDELVAELDACFIAFDGIIEKYNLEKIKTIGDSYMCAGGIPVSDAPHVLNMVKAGLEIQQYITNHNVTRIERGLKPWVARIGVHVGPVIAGVVGKKKYAYDVWGSTVNIASRMESNGEAGKVNISHAVYEIVKDYYVCTPRGKISAKNIGDIDMYFIEDKPNGKLTIKIPKELVASR